MQVRVDHVPVEEPRVVTQDRLIVEHRVLDEICVDRKPFQRIDALGKQSLRRYVELPPFLRIVAEVCPMRLTTQAHCSGGKIIAQLRSWPP